MTLSPQVVKLDVSAAQREIASSLRKLADQTDAGEILELVAVYRTSDGKTGNYQSSSRSRTHMAGALLDAAVRRLGYVDSDE